VFPLVKVAPGELARLVGAELTAIERVDGGLTNTIHRVVTAAGEAFAVKHYAGGEQAFTDEVATLRRLAGILPVPEIVTVEPARHAVVYRWIDGIPLDDCRRIQPPAAFASLAEPLGRLLAWLARTDPPDDAWQVAAIVAQTEAQLASGRARERLGPQLADAMRRVLDGARDRLAWGTPCLSHGDLSARNILVQHAMGERWRIGGVIDWEAEAAASPLVDIGSLFRYVQRYDAQFLTDFERGFREADGELPDGWLLAARVMDATLLVDMLDEPRELPGVFADCRMLLAKLVADAA
jgi:aminoglycoside phosphotransferase (APT) family kinase protein